MSTKSRAVIAKGIIEYRPRLSRGIPVGAIVNCADNSGAKTLKVIQVCGYKGTLGRYPSACVGDKIVVTVYKGPFEMRKQKFYAILIRQRKPYRRPDGHWIKFEDNAAVLITPEGELKGTEVRGPVAKEAAERWPKIAGAASIIV